MCLTATSPRAAPRLAKRLTRGRTAAFAGSLAIASAAIAVDAGAALTESQSPMNPAATGHLPPFITSPGTTDGLMVLMDFVVVAAVLAAGVFFFWLHSLPERLVHTSTKLHFDIVAVLGLLSLFTHIHLFWVAALLIALVKIPDFSFLSRHLQSITTSLGRI